jgi:hypothetical protein
LIQKISKEIIKLDVSFEHPQILYQFVLQLAMNIYILDFLTHVMEDNKCGSGDQQSHVDPSGDTIRYQLPVALAQSQ